MARVKIFSDSTCDLPPDLIVQSQIGIVPLYVLFDDVSYGDGVDITIPVLYEKVKETGILPTTAAPSPGEFIRAFAPWVEAGEDIVYIGLSSQFSATINNARLAAQEFPPGRVEVVDSQNLSTGIGLLVMRAADFAAEGLDAPSIAENIRSLRAKVRTEFIIDTLEYLHKGGRCSGITRFIGGVLQIRPSVRVVDGGMVPAQKFRGSRAKALQGLVKGVLAAKERISPERVFVTHSISEDAPYLQRELEKKAGVKEVLISQAGCVISSHCGPNAIGILYIEK